MTNAQLYQAALDAITRLYSDTTVTRETARHHLRSLSDEIDIMLEALET